MKKQLFFTLLAFCFTFAAFAQGQIKFDNETHDFGSFDEGKQMEHVFTFTNTGNAPIIISGVRASCGCTTPSYTKEPVMPGKQGTITAVYNSAGRPGQFNKSITVTSNASEPTKVLTIKGNAVVDPSKDSKIELEKTTFNLGKMKKGEPITQRIKYKSTGATPLQVQSVYSSSCKNCVTKGGAVVSVNPGESGILEIIYTPSEPGVRKDFISIYTNSKSQRVINVTFEGEVIDGEAAESLLKTN
ncbi:DUF1573 domain-containing protein [Hugenholtzia roseola]|uniref:DUF1573 domain-containing protein n=1 Tax=Hugenholtzia roseola TaxID=1002 RepID=UPI0003FD48C4|nr:DUF1573 domain-containing protein [Hugenholtzia roseola]